MGRPFYANSRVARPPGTGSAPAGEPTLLRWRAVFFSPWSVGLMIAALAGWWLLPAAWRTRLPALTVLVVAALLAHLNPFGRVLGPHGHELFHYVLGTRYFAELGYTGLYAAAVLADFEDEPDRFRRDAVARDLETYQPITRGELLERAAPVRARFSSARWADFKADLAALRRNVEPETWHAQGYVIDHGYNGTPLVTALLGGIGRLPGLDSPALTSLAPLFDPYLLALLALGVAALQGAAAALTLLFFLFVNPMNEAAFVGGAYLRTAYLVALAAGLALLAARRFGASGVCLAVSGWLRIFPLAVPVAFLAADLLSPRRAERLRERRGLYAGFTLASLVILVATSAIPAPDGRNPWRIFADDIALHAGEATSNQVGLVVPFGTASGRDRQSGERRYAWAGETARRRAERWPARLLVTAALGVVALLALRRGRDADAFAAALLGVFALIPLSHYYYAVLGLLPLLPGADLRTLRVLAAGFAALALTALPGLGVDLRFTLFSLEIGVLLVALCGVGWGRAGPVEGPAGAG